MYNTEFEYYRNPVPGKLEIHQVLLKNPILGFLPGLYYRPDVKNGKCIAEGPTNCCCAFGAAIYFTSSLMEMGQYANCQIYYYYDNW